MTSPKRLRLTAVVCSAVLAGSLFSGCALLRPTGAGISETATVTDVDNLHVVLINGGGRPAINYYSHLLHLQQLLGILAQAGIPAERITVFSADGEDPGEDLATRSTPPNDDLWRLYGSAAYNRVRPKRYVTTSVDGVTLHPATQEAITEWFTGYGRQLGAGDRVLLYVTDHGEKNDEDLNDNTITLWGKDETLSVRELTALVETLDPEVRLVSLMSQCFSGSFAGIVRAHVEAAGEPTGAACGYFASTRDRPAYGCYPENMGRENVGHSFRFFHGLRETGRFVDAHHEIQVQDATPDVPLRSSELYLRQLMKSHAAKNGEQLHEVADRMLEIAWQDRSRWEKEIRLIDAIGHAFGFFSPRSLGELKEQRERLPVISAHMRRVSKAWKNTLRDSNNANFNRLLASDPSLSERIAPNLLVDTKDDELHSLADELVERIKEVTPPEVDERLLELHRRSEQAADASYRMSVRLGAVLRMRAALLRIAGAVFLETEATPEQREAHAALLDCEDLRLPAGLQIEELAHTEPFPAFDEDVQKAESALPAFMGIRFRPVREEVREDLGLAAGAARVISVYSDTPAQAAGLQVGDIVIGSPPERFEEVGRVRSWTMLSAIDTPRTLTIRRKNVELETTIVPGPFPIEWPSLPGPPAIGSTAPTPKLSHYRGAPLHEILAGPHLLFFWATWCGPCKAAVPMLLEIEQDAGLPVVAITDESEAQLDKFFDQFEGFPANVYRDEFRQSFVQYGVSGTPTFVLVDDQGAVRQIRTGFSAIKGLDLEEWK